MKCISFGFGYWGKNYARELAGHLVAVIEPNAERAEMAKQIYNVKAYPELPDDIDFDAAVIATPPDSHVALAEPLLKQGKYVLVEKPVACSVEEAMRLWPYRDRCMVGLLYLHHPIITDMLDWLKGNPCDHAYARRTNAGPVRPWGDAMWDLASHDISIFNRLFGQCIGVEATGQRDWAILRLDYVAVSAVVYVSWLGGPKCRKLELVPTYDVASKDRFIFDDVNTVLEITPLRRQLDNFLRGSWGHGTLAEGIDVLKVLEQAQVGIR